MYDVEAIIYIIGEMNLSLHVCRSMKDVYAVYKEKRQFRKQMQCRQHILSCLPLYIPMARPWRRAIPLVQ